MQSDIEDWDLVRLQFVLDAGQRPCANGRAGAGEQHCRRYLDAEGLFLLPHFTDRGHCFHRVKDGTTGRDDDKVGAAHRVENHPRRGSFEVNDNEGHLGGLLIDHTNNGLFADIIDDGQVFGLARQRAPS